MRGLLYLKENSLRLRLRILLCQNQYKKIQNQYKKIQNQYKKIQNQLSRKMSMTLIQLYLKELEKRRSM